MSIICKIKKQLSKNFDIDVEFESSGALCLGVLGASGAGKSMILKCIAGIESPDEGYISVDGNVLFDSETKINLKPQKRSIGYLFQSYALFPTMSVVENITAALKVSHNKKKEIARYWIEKFELSGKERRRPKELSGGEQQRAALARMLASSPKAALFDEPFSALDTALRDYMQGEFSEFLQSGIFSNALLVTHSSEEVYRLCNELIVIDKGRVISKGKTKDIFEMPRSVITAKLTGCKNISKIKHITDGGGEAAAYTGVNLNGNTVMLTD